MQFTLTAGPHNPTQVVKDILHSRGIKYQEPFQVLLPSGGAERDIQSMERLLNGSILMVPHTIFQCSVADDDRETSLLHDMKLALMEQEYNRDGTRIHDYDVLLYQPELNNETRFKRYPEGAPVSPGLFPGLPNNAVVTLRKIPFDDISRPEFERELQMRREAHIHQETTNPGSSPEMSLTVSGIIYGMPFYESIFLFHKLPIGKSERLPTGHQHPIELPPYRNGSQRQLRLRDNNNARIVEINILADIYEEHANLTGEEFNQMGMVTRRYGRIFCRRIFWKDT